ncbi:hypothetical protein C8R45DRAFT_1068823 [Mycena sanguinolenta]|nr:hypothetical protein C8R45DRAFT_1068823 [Mycena sanguinolenta]
MSALIDRACTFQHECDEDTNADPFLRLCALTETPKIIRVRTDVIFDPVDDTEFFTGDLRKWGPPSADELLGSPISSFDYAAAVAEPIEFHSTHAALTSCPRQSDSVGPVESSPFEDAPLGPDDDYDSPVEDDEEEHDLESLNALAAPVHSADVSTTTSPFTASSPPLSSEAPSPASARDFDFIPDDDASFWDAEPRNYDACYASDDGDLERPLLDTLSDDDAEEDEDAFEAQYDAFPLLGDLTDDDAEGEDVDADGEDDDDASEFEELRPQANATAATTPTQPTPRLIVPLPSRSKATPSTASPIAGPSTLPHSHDDSDPEADDSHLSDPSGDDDEDSDYDDYRPAPKRRRANSGQAKAASPKRGKGKGKAKAAAPKRTPARARGSKSRQALEDSEKILVAADAPAPEYDDFKITSGKHKGKYTCPLVSLGCPNTKPCKLNGMTRHYKFNHLPGITQECGACGKKLSGRNYVIGKHLEFSCKASGEKVQAAIGALEKSGYKKRKRSDEEE